MPQWKGLAAGLPIGCFGRTCSGRPNLPMLNLESSGGKAGLGLSYLPPTNIAFVGGYLEDQFPLQGTSLPCLWEGGYQTED